MRKGFIAAAVAALVACGGGGGGGPSGPLTGTLGGAPFTPAEGGALVVPRTTCTVGTATLHVSGLLVGFGSFTGLCSFIQTNGLCADKASATLVGVEVVNAGGLMPQSPVGPGDYPVTTGTPVMDLAGDFTVAGADYSKTSATCVAAPSSTGNGGKITVSSVTGTRVTGALANVAFADGSHLGGTFDVPICNATVDICALLNNTCTAPACIQ